MSNSKRLIASALVVCMTSISLPMQATAAIVGTEEAAISTGVAAERDRVTEFLSRDDVRKSLEAQGVDPQSAIDRVATLSDEEVRQLAGRVDQAPAGGSVIGVLFSVFVILLVTDILGFTKVFPFTRSIR